MRDASLPTENCNTKLQLLGVASGSRSSESRGIYTVITLLRSVN